MPGVFLVYDFSPFLMQQTEQAWIAPPLKLNLVLLQRQWQQKHLQKHGFRVWKLSPHFASKVASKTGIVLLRAEACMPTRQAGKRVSLDR